MKRAASSIRSLCSVTSVVRHGGSDVLPVASSIGREIVGFDWRSRRCASSKSANFEERGRITLAVSFERWCDLIEETEALLLLPLERAHVSEARSLLTLRDPFDRLIAGTAIALGVPLITPDARIAALERVAVIW